MFIYYLSVLLSVATIIGAFPSRISGGHDTTIEEHPYQVLILEDGQFICGGSIISLFYVITAAHCFDNPNSIYIVKSGSNNRHHGGETQEIEKLIIHENYFTKNNMPHNDIALIKVKKPFKFDLTRQPIQLFNYKEEVKPNISATITGWGKTSSNDINYPAILQEVSIPIVGEEICKKIYKGILEDGEICAGVFGENEENFCSGDSGGPLAIGDRLVGIISWGIQFCGTSTSPGVFTEIAHFRNWIDDATYKN